jgi:hypothetical protein
MSDPLQEKYAELKDPGRRAFMIAGERFYPAAAAGFALAYQGALPDDEEDFRLPRSQ